MLNVLVVDDEQAIREGIQSSISWEKYDIRICGAADSAFEALNLIDSIYPEIVILDIRMNDMDGLELLEIINNKYPTIKVILISAYDDFHYAQRAIELKAFSYLLKPIDADKLLAKVLEAKALIDQQDKKIKADQDLNNKLQRNIPILRDTFFIQLINNKISDMQNIKDRTDFLGINLDEAEYMIAIVKIDDTSYYSKTSEYHKNLIKIAIINNIENYFMENIAYHCYCYNLQDNIGLLLCGDHMDKTAINTVFSHLQQLANTSLNTSLTFAMGKVYKSLAEISLSYFEALEALDYEFVLGRNEIIDIEDVYKNVQNASADNTLQETVKALTNKLTSVLKANNEQNVHQVIDEIIQNIQYIISENIKEKDRVLLILSFYISESIMSLNINIDKHFTGDMDFYNQLIKLSTMDAISGYIHNYFGNVFAEMQNRREHHNSYLVSRAIDSINQNIYKDISLTEVAKSVYINPNYLSRIFKQETNKSFIEYVTEVKMNESKKLLKTSLYKIYEIAGMLHYRDVNHFTKVFKKYFGVTPTEYRELV